jgi:hypothetical protein
LAGDSQGNFTGIYPVPDQRKRSGLKRRFGLDDADLEGLKDELMTAQRLAMDEDGKVLVWTRASASGSATGPLAGRGG